METLVTTSNLLILGLTILSPILLLRLLEKKSPERIAVKFFATGLFLMALLIFIFAVWTDISSLMLLNHYGYSVDGLNYENVIPKNRERVDELVTSIMGIGWPLKTVFMYLMTIPYLTIIYFGRIVFNKKNCEF